MNEPTTHSPDEQGAPTRENILAALFANMVIQQTNMAMMLLGKVAHPETGQFMKDLESAKMFIDQLEMIEAKTKGNLSKQEDGLLKQALSALHMTFVEAVEDSPGERASAAPTEIPTPSTPASEPAAAPKPTPAAPPTEAPALDESRKKFSKKY